jgi:CubicO group peptidase (beta-lactamase class C family)
MKRIACSAVFLAVLLSFWVANPVPSSGRDDTPSWQQKADELVKPLLEKKKLNQVVIGVIDRQGKRHILTYGEKPSELEKLDGNTIFEIGSISKVFTSLLLADAVVRGEVKLDDPVKNLLPDSVEVPKHDDKEITLEELACHCSGLPRAPGNLLARMLGSSKTFADPYAGYDEKMLYEALKKVKVKTPDRNNADYSNLGGGLLGFALSKKLSKSYESLVLERITLPLAMRDTKMTLSEGESKRLIPGHDQFGQPTHNWNFQDTFAGAGALRSTANDMLTFLEVQMGRKASLLQKAMELTHQKHAQMANGMPVCLGWIGSPPKEAAAWWHNGGTGGYSSFCLFRKEPAVGVVVLSNRFSNQEIDKIGVEVGKALSEQK